MSNAIKDIFDSYYSPHPDDDMTSHYRGFVGGYSVALAKAFELIGELYDYIANDECTQYLPEKLLNKARKFMETKDE